MVDKDSLWVTVCHPWYKVKKKHGLWRQMWTQILILITTRYTVLWRLRGFSNPHFSRIYNWREIPTSSKETRLRWDSKYKDHNTMPDTCRHPTNISPSSLCLSLIWHCLTCVDVNQYLLIPWLTEWPNVRLQRDRVWAKTFLGSHVSWSDGVGYIWDIVWSLEVTQGMWGISASGHLQCKQNKLTG